MTTTQPTSTEPKRNWFARHKISTALVGVVAVAIVIAAVNSGGSDTTAPGATSSQSDSSRPDPASPAVPDAGERSPGIGAAIRDGKFEFVVVSAQPGVPTVGEDFMTETAQGEYVLVTMSVRNIGDRAQSFTTSAQKLLDGQGRQFSVDDMATIVLDQGIAFEQINPGNSIEATIVFDVPAGTVPAEIELHDSLFSGGTTVALQ
ncbi:DUF4352 domain-containing protein [Rhodococcoides yunnanense]|uniref:DUF4352 domain-containing protein n=1 Tax=Rhodococcoides yunnanense TaxID=278209 RepID=UPI000933923E|nr:DUF4352 domain-containing protein [Rhodococcus yunnanensis]